MVLTQNAFILMAKGNYSVQCILTNIQRTSSPLPALGIPGRQASTQALTCLLSSCVVLRWPARLSAPVSQEIQAAQLGAFFIPTCSLGHLLVALGLLGEAHPDVSG